MDHALSIVPFLIFFRIHFCLSFLPPSFHPSFLHLRTLEFQIIDLYAFLFLIFPHSARLSVRPFVFAFLGTLFHFSILSILYSCMHHRFIYHTFKYTHTTRQQHSNTTQPSIANHHFTSFPLRSKSHSTTCIHFSFHHPTRSGIYISKATDFHKSKAKIRYFYFYFHHFHLLQLSAVGISFGALVDDVAPSLCSCGLEPYVIGVC